MSTFTRKTGYRFSLGCLYTAIAMSSMATYGATATVEVTITASGTETANVAQPYSAPLNGIPRFDTGCSVFCNGTVTRSTDETRGIPVQYSHCAIDTTRGNKLPGLSVYVSSANSPGRDMSENYTLDIPNKRMRAQVSVTSVRKQGAWYTASYEIHVKCPKTLVPWTRSETRTITLDSKNGYANVGSYAGPVGSGGVGTSDVVVNDALYTVELKNPVPANAVITADMFLNSPPDTAKGPKLFALYEPDNLPVSGVKGLPSFTDSNEGGGMSIGDINNNGIEDIIFATYQDKGANTDNEYKYQIGWDIDTEGNAKAWSLPKVVWGTGWTGHGASVALFKPTLAGAPTRAVFVNYDAMPDIRIQYGSIDSNGDFSQSGYLSTPSFGAKAYGVGVELYNLDGNDKPEIILSGNSSYHKYKIGWNLTDSGTVERWTEYNGNSYSTTAVGVALGNLDRNPRPEIVMAYRNPSDNRVYRTIGWNLDQDGIARQWEAARPVAMTLPATAHRIDIALMDLDVFGQTSQRGSGHREKTMVIAGLDSSTNPDNFLYSFLRHSNAKDGVFNGSMTTTARWHSWGTPLPTLDGTRTALCGSNTGTVNPWDAGVYSQEPISIVAGKTYAITFDAEVATNATIGVKLGSATVNTAVYGQNLALALKPGWNRYQMVVGAGVTDPNARLEFFFGGATAASNVCIDNVRFATRFDTTNDFANFPDTSSNPLIKNGYFDYGSMAGWEIKSEAAGTTQAATKIKNGELCHSTPGATNLVKESLGQNNIALQAGATYTLAFDVRGNNLPPIAGLNPKFDVKIGGDGPFFDEYMLASAVEAPKTKTRKTFKFTMGPTADSAAGLAIFTGNTYASEICIDNVSLTK
jgi:hypothetical protein